MSEPTTANQDGRQQLQLFLRLLLPVLLLIAIGAGLIGYLQWQNQERRLSEPQEGFGLLARQISADFITHYANALRSLATQELSVRRATEARDPDDPGLRQAFSSLLSRDPEVTQVRWIAENGRELTRANRRGGKAVFVERAQLQDKGQQSYFQQGLKLLPGEILVSQIDLNVEHGAVEEPYTPTLRLIMRVVGADSEPMGLFVLNVAVANLLDHLYSLQAPRAELYLLNKRGELLRSPIARLDFGFVFGRDAGFMQMNRTAWTAISGSSDGQVMLSDGLWTWRNQSLSVDKAGGAVNEMIRWVSVIPASELESLRWSNWGRVISGALLLGLVFGVFLWRLAGAVGALNRAEQARLTAQARTEELSAELARLRGDLEPWSLSPVGESLYGVKSLRSVAPDLFEQIVSRYRAIIEETLEEQVLLTDKGTRNQLRTLAKELGNWHAGPRDVIELHKLAIGQLGEVLPAPRVKALIDEARLVLLELMGHLALHYRQYHSLLPSTHEVSERADLDGRNMDSKG